LSLSAADPTADIGGCVSGGSYDDPEDEWRILPVSYGPTAEEVALAVSSQALHPHFREHLGGQLPFDVEDVFETESLEVHQAP
jgi:hypothetical protein